MSIDVTDNDFQTQVVERSKSTPVVVDLWAPWCGPCQSLGPILERVIDATGGRVVLAKVNVDENPGISNAFQVQSIPAVYALKDGAVIDGFMGAYPEDVVAKFLEQLLPSPEEVTVASLVEQGTEEALLMALEMEPGNEDAICALAEIYVERGDNAEALQLLGRIPETDRTRLIAAKARVQIDPDDDYEATLDGLLDSVKTDEEARQEFVDILELMGPNDPRTAVYRRKLTARLF